MNRFPNIYLTVNRGHVYGFKWKRGVQRHEWIGISPWMLCMITHNQVFRLFLIN